MVAIGLDLIRIFVARGACDSTRIWSTGSSVAWKNRLSIWPLETYPYLNKDCWENALEVCDLKELHLGTSNCSECVARRRGWCTKEVREG